MGYGLVGRSSNNKIITLGYSTNQILIMLALAAAGGAAAMYFVPQLPSYIMGLFKGTETPQSVIQKVKTDVNNRKSSPVVRPPKPVNITQRSTPKPIKAPVNTPIIVGRKSDYALKSHYTRFSYY